MLLQLDSLFFICYVSVKNVPNRLQFKEKINCFFCYGVKSGFIFDYLYLA